MRGTCALEVLHVLGQDIILDLLRHGSQEVPELGVWLWLVTTTAVRRYLLGGVSSRLFSGAAGLVVGKVIMALVNLAGILGVFYDILTFLGVIYYTRFKKIYTKQTI